MAKQVLMPPARLESRPTDIKFTDDLYPKIALFAQLKKKLSLDKYPGTLVIRRFKPGEVICRQGEAGWTACYILLSEDILRIRQLQMEAMPAGRERRSLETEFVNLAQRVATFKSAGQEDPERRAVTQYLSVARPTAARAPGLLQRLAQRFAGVRGPDEGGEQGSIRIDGPRDIDRESMQAPLHEGDLFGEMSCLYGTPRSATIIADRECYMLEMLRNILEQLQKDPAYKAHIDKVYKERSFQLHLRKLSLFSDLTEEQFATLRDKVDLLTFEAGQVIYDEFDRSDSMYIIRSGLVKVVKKVSALLNQDHIRNWQALGKALCEGEKPPASPRGKIWQLLPEGARAAARAAAQSESVADAERLEILRGLNEVIKNRQLPDAKEFLTLIKREVFAEQGFPEKPKKDILDQELRRFNRILLEVIFEGIIRNYVRRVGPDRVLFYCSRGDFIGEMGLLTHLDRAESCIAHGHPQDAAAGREAGRAEVVRIPNEVFNQLLQEAPAIARQVERKIAERRKQTKERGRVPIWDDSRQVLFSEQFDKLGLMQGQRLMVIDLDRCTRCDECVRACVDTHADGHSRLFLDGPRFGKYLVPTTCRSCLDPVCMIGCPVGSIHRGNNGQIAIEDWCIGCGLCAQQCPYGSIQMHDLGIIAENARGWRYLPASALSGKANWTLPGFKDAHWVVGTGPFQNDRVFRESVAPYEKATAGGMAGAQVAATAFSLAGLDMRPPDVVAGRVGQPLCFRFEFELSADLVRSSQQFRLEVTTPDAGLAAWVNGYPVQVSEKPRGGRREYLLPPKEAPAEAPAANAPGSPKPPVANAPGSPKPPVANAPGSPAAAAPSKPTPPPKNILRAGRNVLALLVTPDANSPAVFLKVRMDEVRKPAGAEEVAEEVTQKLVTDRAVVCDLCSSQLGQRPACVTACPHDAALRVDARFDFPVR